MRASPALPAIRKAAAPLRRQVLEELRQSIISGRLGSGTRLIERELIAMMGVSRTVLREVLRQLETEGLIAIIPNKGPVVRALTLDEAKDIYSIRAVLEGLAARLFVAHASEAQVKKLEQALSATVAAYEGDDPERILRIKNRFYDYMFEGAASETLSSMIATLHARIWRWRALGLSHPRRSAKRSREATAGLEALFAALKGRDAEQAERIARDEVTKAAEEVIHLLGSDERIAAVAPMTAASRRRITGRAFYG